MRPFERALVSLDQGVIGSLYRIVVGYLIVPTWAYVVGSHASGASLVLFFAGVLLALRVVPAVLRKILPFSRDVQKVWAERRQVAKRIDSYQWRKLLWIGIGLAVVAVRSDRPGPALPGLAFTCLVAGAVGETVWRYRGARRQVRDIG